MVAGLFDSILRELSEALKIGTLESDENHSCLLRFNKECELQLEMSEESETLIIGARIGHVPPGSYRIDVFREALKSNALPFPHPGIFAYSDQADELVLFHMMPGKNLTGYKVAEALGPFVLLASQWQKAIKEGETPSINVPAAEGGQSGMFGLKL